MKVSCQKQICILLFLLFFFFAQQANAGTKKVMEKILNSWIGYSLEDVMSQWGYPDEEKIIAGKKLYYWHNGQQYYANSASAVAMPVYYCTRILEFDERDVVQSWSYRGNNCPFALKLKYKREWLNNLQ